MGVYITSALMRQALIDNDWDTGEARLALGIPAYDSRRITRLLGIKHMHDMEAPQIEPGGVIQSPEDTRIVLPVERRTMVFTSAQSNTLLHEGFFENLLLYCNINSAQLHVARFTYNKKNHGEHSRKPGDKQSSDQDAVWFDPKIAPYISDEQIEIAPGLVWCGELNILPTRVDPLTGFEAYGRGASVIVPHVKMAMRSVARMKGEPPRFMYSTGTVTQRNYIEQAAGQKASLHHVYGALVVEVDERGNWWARQINADGDGNFYDLDKTYGYLTGDPSSPVASITHGDLHGYKFDPEVVSSASCMVHALKPQWNVFHDTIDFMPRNHHNMKDPWHMGDVARGSQESVQKEFTVGANLIRTIRGDHGAVAVITSNHDTALDTWLKNTAGFHDGKNSAFWCQQNAMRLSKGPCYKPFPAVMIKELAAAFDTAMHGSLYIIDEDQSLIIAGIEHGLHGHLGPNGARGAPKNLRVVGKANTAHTHSASIYDGVYTAGVYGKLDMGYNKGPSSWSHSAIITHCNGKRQIVTLADGKFWRDKNV